MSETLTNPTPAELREFDALCDAVFDGAASAEQVARLEGFVLNSPVLRRRYVELADQEATLAWGDGELAPLRIGEAVEAASPPPPDRPRRRLWPWVAVHTALVACAAALWVFVTEQIARETAPISAATAPAPPAAVWAASAGAELFGEAAPTIGAAAPVGREQALLRGWVRLRFADGAEAVLEGPAVFEVAAADRLILKAGRCSVHAPDGAEGFRVDTPDGQVLDLGTRFAVRVREGDGEADGGTEVHVVEGAAELHCVSRSDGTESPDRLVTGQARRLTAVGGAGKGPLAFDPAVYREILPDRVIAYDAQTDPHDATRLTALTVQRAGETLSYPAADLIPSVVTAFHAPEGGYPYAVPSGADGSLGRWLTEPFLLNAGHINPGGSREPLTGDPVLDGPNRTPGLAMRFTTPVTNAPGPDLVLFDIQSVVDPPDGDAFHLSPVEFRPGLRSITVRRYDLTVGDPGSTVVAPFVLPKPDPAAAVGPTLDAVRLTDETPRLVPSLGFTANAVVVDLSDLGYAAGETADALFVQDARDDPKYIDPTLIVGLPADPPRIPASSSHPRPRRDTP
ncbi:FecR family protein [Alienimonas californiensis]|uniref:FecR protein n=1 Tax=Alienimonas californiensis TaxID=2527989 RepID=A0A517PFQ7_9PLAN|nr:FecR family protein [Alienimonas californiensis]QDT18223.1 FecR protein [Alienimonas californiensis]